LTTEFVKVMGGVESSIFTRFRKRLAEGFKALNKNAEKIILLVQMIGSA